MKLSLYQKLSITLLLTFILIVIAFLYTSQSIDTNSKDNAEQRLHHQLAEHLVHDNPLLASGKFDHVALENLFHSMMILGQNFEFYVLDTQGEILSFSAKPGEVVREKVALEPILAFLNGHQQLPIYAQDPRSSGDKIFSTAPIYQDKTLKGYLYVIVRSQIYDGIFEQISSNGKVQVYGLVTISSILFLFILLLVSFRFIVAPLKHLTSQVELLKQDGSSQQLVELESSGKSVEVDGLTFAFNQLIGQVNDQVEKLKQVDAERRELFEHLSHDLRTPLASLHGFLETIDLQQSELSEVDRRTYINRCLKNARQLKRFVDQIFELANLESGQVSTTFEPLPIAELLFDLVDKFAYKAKDKKIMLRVDVSDESLEIVTDIAKLERVLSNLVENAIRHTPPDGVITLGVLNIAGTDQVLVEVRDTGTGIPEQDLLHLFDPRFRGSKALDDGERHIGLGLTITEKLLRIIGSEIKVANNSDAGAKFSFCLPVS
ncbi:MAG: HAMP domain-containing histidine kinase [Kangiellaceae bacterium]|nr:HAMP domain-containing histidine kinase [Kangiellaceae bacterium]